MAESPVVRVTASDASLRPDPLEHDQVIAGDPRTDVQVIATGPGGGESGVWRCTPGTFRDVEADETFVVLAGRATIEWDGGSVDVGPGDVCVLAAGTETVWTVRETLLKGFRIEPSGAA